MNHLLSSRVLLRSQTYFIQRKPNENKNTRTIINSIYTLFKEYKSVLYILLHLDRINISIHLKFQVLTIIYNIIRTKNYY